MLLSVGRTGVCWDNAQIESFWSTLKTEFYDRHHFATRTGAIHAVSSWIKTVYNRRRRHSALGQVLPVTFEHWTITAASEAASPMSTRRGQPQMVLSIHSVGSPKYIELTYQESSVANLSKGGSSNRCLLRAPWSETTSVSESFVTSNASRCR